MKKLLLSAMFIAISSTSFGALSSYHQGGSEIKKILDTPLLHSLFSPYDVITEIKIIETTDTHRIYAISSGDKTVAAKVDYIKSARCGPRQFTISFSSLSN